MLVPCLHQSRERGLAKLLEINAPYLGAERSTGGDHLDLSGGVAFRRRRDAQGHLPPPSAATAHEHSSQRPCGNRSICNRGDERPSLSRRGCGPAAVAQLEIEIAPIDEDAESLAQDEDRVADVQRVGK